MPNEPERPERKAAGLAYASLILVLGLLLGVVIRLWLAKAGEGQSFSDNAVVALMAMRALRGKFYTFYWGQSYMGSLEAIVVAPFFAVLGANDFALSVGLLPWYVVFAAVLYAVTELCGGAVPATIALALAALAPADVQYYQITARGGYPATLAFGTTLLWLALRTVYVPLSPPVLRRHLLLIGAIAGLAFWTNWLVIPYYAVVATILLLNDPFLPFRRNVVWLLASFFIGSSPLWMFQFRHGTSLSLHSQIDDAPTYAETLYWVFGIGLPNILGFRDLHGSFAFGRIGQVLLAITAVAACAGVAALRPSWRALATGRIRNATPALSLVLLAGATIGVYVIGLPSRYQIGRYFLPFHSAAVPLMALGVAWLLRRRRFAGALVLASIVVFYGAELVRFHGDLGASKGRYIAGPVEVLAAHLRRSGIRFGYADYGDAALTTYITQERVILADYEERYYPRDELPSEDAALIVRDGELRADTTLDAIDARVEVARIRGYTIYWPVRYDGVPREPLSRKNWKVTTNVTGSDPSLTIDGDPWTYWSVPGTYAATPALTLDLGSDETVAGVYFDLGERDHDWFHRLRVEVSSDLDHWRIVKDAQWDLLAAFDREGRFTMRTSANLQLVLFQPCFTRAIRLTLLENNSPFDWSVGELAVFGVARGGHGLEPPSFADPRSAELTERRLYRLLVSEPDSNWPLVELERLYRDNGDTVKLTKISRREREAFTPTVPLGWQFGRYLRLVGYDSVDSQDGRRRIVYYWQALRPMPRDCAITAHFDGPQGRFQDDFYPGAPGHGSSKWAQGEIVKAAREIAIPQGAPTGRYSLRIGAWFPETRERLPVRLGWFRTAKDRLLETIHHG